MIETTKKYQTELPASGWNQFDHEQDIMACWHIVDDIDQLLEMILDRDASKDNIANVLAGLSVLYGDRFAKLHDNFEKLLANMK